MDSTQLDLTSKMTPEVRKKMAADLVGLVETSVASFPLGPDMFQIEVGRNFVSAPIKTESVAPNHSDRVKTFLPIKSIFRTVIDRLLSNYESQKQTLRHLLKTTTNPRIIDLTNIKLQELELLKKFQAIPDGSRDLWEIYLNLIDSLEIVLKEKYNENIPEYIALAIKDLKDLREAFSSSDIGVNYIAYLKSEDGTTKNKIIYSSSQFFSSGYGEPNPVSPSYKKPILNGYNITGGIYNYYIGNIVNGQRDGHGILFYGTQELFLEGTWENNIFIHGREKTVKPDGTLISTISRMPFREDGNLIWRTVFDGPSTFFSNNGGRIETLWEEGTLKQTKLIYANGDVYEGDLKDDKRHGPGKFTYANGAVYEGDFKDGKMHGRGKFIYANGDVYEGDFKDDKLHGRGKVIYANDDKLKSFDGTWSNNKFSNGKLVYNSGSVYEGDFNKGGTFPDGEGLMIFDEENEEYKSFDGTWSCGNFINGELEYANHNIYQGDFDKNTKHGTGIMFYKNGNMLNGTWEHGEIVRGKFTPHDDTDYKSYTGSFIDGVPNDTKGTVIHRDGLTYIGGVESRTLADDEGIVILRHGHGILKKNGNVLNGTWEHGEIVRGKFTPHDGTDYKSYTGSFIGGVPNDTKGTIIYHDGTYIGGVKSRKLADGKGMAILRHGHGILTENGISYEGIWNDNTINGKTTIKYQDGSEFIGNYNFNNGKREVGIIKYNSNHYYKGIFGLDELNQPNGSGEETFIEGDKKIVYEGRWQEGKRNGQFEVRITENGRERIEIQHYLNGKLQPTMQSGPGNTPEDAFAASASTSISTSKSQ